jgi:hypothetical protein
MTTNLSPVVIQDFFINGQVAVGAQLFTYQAGTTTKANVYTDSTGATAFTNPIILNSRGEPENVAGASTGIWLPPGVAYKFVFAPSTDTDPPTHPIWTVDNIVAPISSAGDLLTGLPIIYPSGGDDGPILAALTTPAILAGGQFQILSNATLGAHTFILAPPANFYIATGMTLAFTGGLFVGFRGSIFNNATAGLGTVTFSSYNIEGYPEWWGAQPNTPAFDCSAAINACIVACPVTQLAQANYYTANPIVITMNGKTLRGVTWEQNAAATSSQIVLTSATTPGIICGTNQTLEPVNIISNIELDNFTVYRSVPPNNPSSGVLPAPTAIQFMWCSLLRCSDVMALEHSIGFYIYGCVESYWDRCSTIRSVPGVHTSNDNFSGFYLDYSAPFAGYNGGNASIYLNRCRTFPAQALTLTYSACITTYQGCVDLFITQPESGFCQYGADLNGGSSTYSSEDCTIIDAHFDSCSIAGIACNNMGAYTNITVEGGYINVTQAAGSCVQATGVLGLLKVSGMQFFTSVVGTGFLLNTCNNFQSFGNTMLDLQSMAKLTSVTSFSMEDNVVKKTAPHTLGPAVTLVTCSRGYIRPIINGGAGSFTCGVSVDGAGTTHIEVNCTVMQPVAFGGAANKILLGGSPWGGTTSFNTNCVASGDLT